MFVAPQVGSKLLAKTRHASREANTASTLKASTAREHVSGKEHPELHAHSLSPPSLMARVAGSTLTPGS